MKQIKSSIEVLSQAELMLIHNAALKTLSRVGMKVPNDEVLDMCAAEALSLWTSGLA